MIRQAYRSIDIPPPIALATPARPDEHRSDGGKQKTWKEKLFKIAEVLEVELSDLLAMVRTGGAKKRVNENAEIYKELDSFLINSFIVGSIWMG